MSKEQSLTLLLNTRHEDLVEELQLMFHCNKVSKTLGKRNGVEAELNAVANGIQARLIKLLEIDEEEVAEDEEVDIEEVDFNMIGGAIETAIHKAKSKYGSYLQFDRTINVLKSLGASDEEVEKLQDVKKRLEEKVFTIYDITEDDLKEDSDE